MVKRKIIEIDEDKCTGCGQCVVACAEGALEIVDGKAKVIRDSFCDGLGACIGDCPEDALKIVERDVDEFDEAAVEEHLQKTGRAPANEEPPKTLECGCPASTAQTLRPGGCPSSKAQSMAPGDAKDAGPSQLGHWPIQIKLVNPRMPFIQGADLVVLADCCAVAYANLHKDFIKDKVVVIGCPKFDDIQFYMERFNEYVTESKIKSISVVHMEVPCCHALSRAVKAVMDGLGNPIPAKRYVISLDGKLTEEEL